MSHRTPAPIMATLVCVTAALAINPDWTAPVVIQSVGDVGRYVSLASNPATNQPAVSYYSDAEFGTLRFAEFDGSAWNVTSVTTFVGITDVFTSLVFIDGRPTIAFYDYQRGRLRYAERDAGGAWQIVTVDGNDSGPLTQIGADCSLAILPSGEPGIAYVDRQAGALKFARRNAGTWTKETVPGAASQVGGGCSLDVIYGAPAISFVRNGRLTYAWLDATWQVSAALDASAAPSSTALVDLYGIPAVAYNDTVSGRLLLARYAGGAIALPTSWRRSTADAAAAATLVRIRNGPDGVPILASHSSDPATGGIKLTRAPDVSFPLWQRTTVETPNTRGSHFSCAYVGARPALASYDSVAKDLLYTRLAVDDDDNGIPDDIEPDGPTGACCTGATCSIGTASACGAIGGVYLGDGAPCSPNYCAGATGACCLGESCVVVSGAACEFLLGAYLGNGSPCNSALCAQRTGACCTGEQCSVRTPWACDGAYVGDGTTCIEDLCVGPTGGCCIGGGCSLLTPAACNLSLGAYLGDGIACDENACADTTGACCVGESCFFDTPARCDSLNGAFLGVGTQCSGQLCAGPLGACCINGACLSVTIQACGVAGGFFTGPGIACSDNLCTGPTGACCLGLEPPPRANGLLLGEPPPAFCLELTLGACILLEGSFIGQGTTCAPDLCAGPTGACCVGSACILFTEAACSAASGQFFGPGEPCVSGLCDGPTGACCIGSACVVVTALGCAPFEGLYLGDGTACGENPCAGPTGACCLDGDCIHTTAAACSILGRSYRGDQTFCPFSCLGDMNCDGEVNFFDIDPFVLALSGQVAYNDPVNGFPCCPWLNGDINADQAVNFFDIDGLVGLLGSFCGR